MILDFGDMSFGGAFGFLENRPFCSIIVAVSFLGGRCFGYTFCMDLLSDVSVAPGRNVAEFV